MSPAVDTLHCTDCFQGMSKLPPGTVRLAFADPPFNIGYEYDVYRDRKARDEYLAWSRKWMRAVRDLLSPDGAFWLAIGDEYAAELKLIAQNELGFVCRSWVIWYYTFGVHCTTKFTRSHTHLFHFVRDPQNFTFNDSAIRVPSARQLVYADGRANPQGRVPDDTWILRPQDLSGGFGGEEDTWYFSRVCGTFKERTGWHGCQMPEQLLARIIRVSSNPGDLVLDPFVGSGTTLVVAKKLHRRWIGFELSPAYAKSARERLDRVTPGDLIEGPENPLTSSPSTAAGRALLSVRRSERNRPARVGASPVIQRLNLSLGQIAVASGELTTAITEAYLAACDGYTIDRVLADPRYNDEFHKACHELAIPGQPVDWNRRLLRLRKAGKLRALPTPRRTAIPWSKLDAFVFASEIAWQIVSDENEGASLDDILCDPALAKQFDQTAGRFAPGWSPFEYRWAALTLRKKARDKRRFAEKHADGGGSLQQLSSSHLRVTELKRVPAAEGLYVMRIPEASLYLGETANLQNRVRLQAEHLDELLRRLGLGSTSANDVAIGLLPLPGHDAKYRWGLQSRLMGNLRPRANVNELQAFPP